MKTVLAFSIAFVAVFGSVTAALSSSSQFATAQVQQNNSTAKTTTAKPVDGYGGPPTGPLTAVRHIFDDPALRVVHFCKPNDKVLMVCQLYDSNSPNATLIGVEYMIDSNAYKALPDREKPRLALPQGGVFTGKSKPHISTSK